MDLFLFTSFFIFSFCIFQFSTLLTIFLFIFSILFLFNFVKSWIMLIIFMIYLGGIFILLIYISSFSSKKSFTLNNWFLLIGILIYYFEMNFDLIFSFLGMDFILNFYFIYTFLFMLFFFFLVLLSVSTLCPMGKSVRSL